jgi:hypothetical protein
MISFRFAPVVCILFALAAVPTLLHSYSTTPVADARSAGQISDSLAGYAAVPSKRSDTWGKRRFDSDDWVERIYVSGETSERLRLTVVRTFDAKSVYHHPELAVVDGASFVGQDVKRFEERPDIPVYVMRRGPGEQTTAMYVLHYDQRFVENPIKFQLRTAGELLFSRRKPMTLFFVQDADRRGDAEAPRRLLFAAIDSFLEGRSE